MSQEVVQSWENLPDGPKVDYLRRRLRVADQRMEELVSQGESMAVDLLKDPIDRFRKEIDNGATGQRLDLLGYEIGRLSEMLVEESGGLALEAVSLVDNPAIAENLRLLRDSLEQSGMAAEDVEKMLDTSSGIYQNIYGHLGSSYWEEVNLKRPNGPDWIIQNSCVGGVLKAFDGLFDLRVKRGRQAGRPLSNFSWADQIPFGWLKAIVDDEADIKTVKFSQGMEAEEIDRLVGAQLLPGEPAVATFNDHEAILFKGSDGQVMMYHSGADFRPKRIKLEDGEEPPYGYELREDGYAHKTRMRVPDVSFARRLGRVGNLSSSKTNIIPLATYVKMMKNPYVKFVSLRDVLGT